MLCALFWWKAARSLPPTPVVLSAELTAADYRTNSLGRASAVNHRESSQAE